MIQSLLNQLHQAETQVQSLTLGQQRLEKQLTGQGAWINEASALAVENETLKKLVDLQPWMSFKAVQQHTAEGGSAVVGQTRVRPTRKFSLSVVAPKEGTGSISLKGRQTSSRPFHHHHPFPVNPEARTHVLLSWHQPQPLQPGDDTQGISTFIENDFRRIERRHERERIARRIQREVAMPPWWTSPSLLFMSSQGGRIPWVLNTHPCGTVSPAATPSSAAAANVQERDGGTSDADRIMAFVRQRRHEQQRSAIQGNGDDRKDQLQLADATGGGGGRVAATAGQAGRRFILMETNTKLVEFVLRYLQQWIRVTTWSRVAATVYRRRVGRKVLLLASHVILYSRGLRI